MQIKTIALIAALSAAALASADDTKGTTSTKDRTTDTSKTDKKTAKAKPTDAELQVLAHYHHLNQAEIDMGKLAQKVGATRGVKNYGMMLVTDHGKNDREILAFAKKSGVTVPKETPANEAEAKDMKDDEDAMMKLHTMKGADFDREFLSMMVQGHEKELAKIDTNIGKVSNSDLQAMLKDDTKPMLQKHEDAARELQKSNAQASLNK
ncbi:MAG: hypothetical protein JWO36_1410 [Myxococcales bacterium]|nr:hypothetical protein [Myxococcales bacterium]